MAYSGYKGITIKFGADTTQLGKALREIDNEAKESKKNVTELNKALKADPKNVNLMAEKYKELSKQIANTKERLETLKSAEAGLKSALDNGTEGAKDNWEAYQQELKRTETRLKTLEKQAVQTTNALKNQLVEGLKGLKTQLSSVVKILATAETAFVGLSAKSVKTGMDFDSAMSQVAATMGKTTDEISNLRDYAQQMGETTAFSATESAQALNYMALAGYDAEKSMQMLPNVLNLAAAGGLDLASASDMVTDAQSALGLSMEDTTRLVDQMATTASKSNTSVGQLGEAILTVGGTAKALKGGTTEMATALGILADNGVKSAEGGTALRNIILSLTAPTTTAAKELEKLNISINDENGNVRALNDIFNDLSASLDGMGTGERTQVLNEIFNKVDLKSVNALLSNCGQRFDELSGYIDKANGSAKQMATTQLDNLQGDLTLLKSEAEGLQIAISDKISPALRDLVQNGTKELSDLIQKIKNGGLDKTFEQFGKDLSELISTGIHTAAQMLPAIIKFLTAIIGHLKEIIALVVAYKGLNVLITTTRNVKAVVSALSGFVSIAREAGGVAELLKTKISGLSTGMKAMGAVGAAAAIGGIVAALINYKTEQMQVTDTTDRLSQSQRNLANQIEETAQQITANSEEIKSSVEKYEALRSVSKRTADEIYSLAEKENKSAEEKAKLKAKIDELNGSIPDLNANWDENTQQMNMNRQEMNKLIDAYVDGQARAFAESKIAEEKVNQELLQNNYKKINEEYTKAHNEFLDLFHKQEEIKKQLNELDNYTFKGKSYTELTKELENIKPQVDAASTKFTQLKKECDKASDAVEKSKDNQSVLEKYLKRTTSATEDNTKATEKSTETTEDNADALEELGNQSSTAKSELSELSQIQNQLNEGQSLSTETILNLIDKYPELAAAIKSTKDGYTVEADAIKALMKLRIENIKQIQAEKVATLEKQKAEADASYNAQINAIKETQAKIEAQKTLELFNLAKKEKKTDAFGTEISNDFFENIQKSFSGDLIKLIERQRDKANSSINTQLKNAKAQLEAYNKIYADIESSGFKSGSNSSTSTKSTKSSTSTSKSYKSTEDKYKAHVEKLLDTNEYYYNIGKKSEEQYYNYIRKVRDKYYKGHKKYTSEYRQLTVELHNYEVQKAEQSAQRKKEIAQQEAEKRKQIAETQKIKIEAIDDKYINGGIKSKKEYIKTLENYEKKYFLDRNNRVKKGYETADKILNQHLKNANKLAKQAQAEAEKRAVESAKTTGSIKENYYDWQYNMSDKDLKAKQVLLKHYQDIDKYYYKNKTALAEEHRQMLLKIKNLQDDISSEQERIAEETIEKYKSNVEKQKDALTDQFEAGTLDAFKYYQKLQELNDKYYKNRKDCAEEYAQLQKEINEGIKQAQEDNINNILDLSEKTNDVIQATEKLRGAEKKQKIYYDSARGFYHGTDITAVTEAKTDLYNAQKDLMQQAISLNGNLTASELSKILSNLPSFSGISLPPTTTNNSNKTVTNSFVFSGDIKTENPEDFLKQINDYVKQSGIDLMIGR